MVNTTIKDILEAVSKPSPSLVPTGMGADKFQLVNFYTLCLQDVGIDFKISTLNGHFIILLDTGLQFWISGKGYG